jgi:hypothetical protein
MTVGDEHDERLPYHDEQHDEAEQLAVRSR